MPPCDKIAVPRSSASSTIKRSSDTLAVPGWLYRGLEMSFKSLTSLTLSLTEDLLSYNCRVHVYE
jgi:hypothetical protein